MFLDILDLRIERRKKLCLENCFENVVSGPQVHNKKSELIFFVFTTTFLKTSRRLKVDTEKNCA